MHDAPERDKERQRLTQLRKRGNQLNNFLNCTANKQLRSLATVMFALQRLEWYSLSLC